MLKLVISFLQKMNLLRAAAFGRLCVETQNRSDIYSQDLKQPPSGGCVLKLIICAFIFNPHNAAAFGRLCVETSVPMLSILDQAGSRLRAAVC